MNSPYQELCAILSVQPCSEGMSLLPSANQDVIAHIQYSERVTLGLRVLLDLLNEDPRFDSRIDKTCLDYYINKLDQKIGAVLDEVLHHPEFQQMETLWRSLHFVAAQLKNDSNCICELLSVSQSELQDDFDLSDEITHTGLYKHLYSDEYDMPGGEPFAAVITPFEFSASRKDVNLLTLCSTLGALTHCPFIASVGPQFFGKSSWGEVDAIDDLTTYLERTEYLHWNRLRKNEISRYLGLVLPRFLLRQPYDEVNSTTLFQYHEHMSEAKALWSSSAYAFANRLCASFIEQGWCVNIRGPQAGGIVSQLPTHIYYDGCHWCEQSPVETMISEARELCLSELGFISLSSYKNRDYACFFSANSLHQASLFDTADATANSRINARLPYVFLCSRLAHYLKVLQRESIGSNKTRLQLETELNQWLQTLVTTMQHPSPELAASHPLREASVEVLALQDNPGMYRVNLFVMPHFQIEGMDVRLALVSQLPSAPGSN